MPVWLILISPLTVHSVTIYVLLGLVVICFILNLRNLASQSVQKIVGGLTVFVVALLSRHVGVIGLSLFIGGLIIASEEFMAKLAIIFRSESKDLGTNVASLTAATKTEIQTKNKEETLELVAAQVVPPPTPAAAKTLVSKGAQAKTVVLDYLQDKYSNEKYQILPDQKVDSPDFKNSVLVDGVVVRNTPDKSDIVGLIETQYVGNAYKFDRLLDTILRRAELLNEVVASKPIVFYLVIEEKLNDNPKFLEFLKKLNKSRDKATLKFRFFEFVYIKGDQIVPSGTEISLDLLTRS